MKDFYTEDYFKKRLKYNLDSRLPIVRTIARTLVEEFDPKSVLDVGCAKGHLVYAFKGLGLEAYGVDISEYAISQSPPEVRDHLSNVDVDHEQLPFADQTFDLVNASEVMEHLTNHRNLLSEIRRVLRARGIVHIMAERRHATFLARLVGARAFGHLGRNPTHINIHPKSFWIREFESHGFNYIGDLARQALKEVIHLSPPQSEMGRLLLKFGAPGRWLRVELGFALRRESLLFRKAWGE